MSHVENNEKLPRLKEGTQLKHVCTSDVAIWGAENSALWFALLPVQEMNKGLLLPTKTKDTSHPVSRINSQTELVSA